MQPESNSKRSADNAICSDAAAFVYGGLSDAGRDAFEVHLKTCSACRQFVDDIRSIIVECPPSNAHEMAGESESARSQLLAEYVKQLFLHEPLQRYKRIIRALTAACLLLILAVATLWIRLESVENAGDKLSQDATALHRAMGSFLEHSGHIVDQIVDMHAAAHGSLSSGLAVIVAGGDSMRMFLEAEKLPPPGGSEAYHVWLHEDGRSVHAGTLPMRNGTGAFRYEGVADHYDRIFVTLEPSSSAGSSPIGRIVLSGTLSS